jgi:probable DNA metabolism protein
MLYIYDNTFDGFMTAVFEIYSEKDKDASILPRGKAVNSTFFETRDVAADIEKSKRVQRGISAYDGSAVERLYMAWLSGSAGVEDLMLYCIRLAFSYKVGPFALRQYESVSRLEGIARKVGHEAHRMLQFVRFVKLAENAYAADIEPEYDIIPLIGDHFHGRFPDSRFIIRDVRHLKVISSSPAGWYISDMHGDYPPLPESGDIEELWKMYFDTIAIEQRINPKLQQNFVPKKYRRFLTEFEERKASAEPGGETEKKPLTQKRPELPCAETRNR